MDLIDLMLFQIPFSIEEEFLDFHLLTGSLVGMGRGAPRFRPTGTGPKKSADLNDASGI